MREEGFQERKKERKKGLTGTKVALCLNFTLGSSTFNLSHAYNSIFCCHQALLLSNFTKRNSDIEQPRLRCPLTRIIQMGVVLWRATVSSDFLIVSIDDLEIYCCVTGHPAKEIVQLVNEENIPFTFSFSESSCHTEGYASSLTVEPMSGTIQPKARYGTLSHPL